MRYFLPLSFLFISSIYTYDRSAVKKYAATYLTPLTTTAVLPTTNAVPIVIGEESIAATPVKVVTVPISSVSAS